MKPPTEADLILLENKVLRDWRTRLAALKEFDYGEHFTIVQTLETLIALARDPSALLRSIPDDAALDRAQPPRKAEPKPVSSVQPKPKTL